MLLSVLDDLLNDITNTDTTSYSDTLKHQHLSVAALFLNAEFMKSVWDWKFMGNTITANLVASTLITNRLYAFPANFLKITRIDIMPDGSNWKRCDFLDIGEIDHQLGVEADVTDNFSNDAPFYTIIGNKIMILSGTLTAVTNGIRYWFSEGIVGKNTGGTSITSFTTDSDVPELPEPYQMGLVYYAAKLFFQKFENQQGIVNMDNEVEKIIARMKEFTITNEKPFIKIASDLEDFE